MHVDSLTSAARLARQGNAEDLAGALQASRRDTLATFARYEQALPGLAVPQRDELNPPLWELGHIGWFQEFWLARFPQRDAGAAADPDAARHRPLRDDADALYNSSRVPHDSRWSLPLPDAQATRDELARQLESTLALLGSIEGSDDDAFYFYRLALLHEDMHHEAALYMAQSLGIAIDDARWQAAALPAPPPPVHLPAGRWQLGNDASRGFAFDNELSAHELEVPACAIDAQAVRWAEFLPFVEAGGYRNVRWWDDAGQRWLEAHHAAAPRYLRHESGGWQQWRHGRWRALDLAAHPVTAVLNGTDERSRTTPALVWQPLASWLAHH